MRRQDGQFSSTASLKGFAAQDIKISMDGKGAWRDTIFALRLWRTIQYDEVYLHAYASVKEAAHIGRDQSFRNTRRPRPSLDGKPPIGPTSTSHCPKRRRRNQGGKPLRKHPEPVQTNRATSDRSWHGGR